MKIDKWLAQAQQKLEATGIGTSRLDTLVLLEDCLGKDRAHLLAHPEIELTTEQQNILSAQIKRRVLHEPLAYIRGKTEFYGRGFIVDKNVLEPRPETETMIELLKKLPLGPDVTIIDIGTGSGALAITAKLELGVKRAVGIDIDKHCLEVARQNAKRLNADVVWLHGDLLKPLSGSQPSDFVLLCNLPYVPENFHINTAATHEPSLAIFGGPDGLDPYRNLFAQLGGFIQKPRYVLTEALPPQHGQLSEIAEAHGFTLGTTEDFIQVFALPG